MAKSKLVMHLKAFAELRNSPEVLSDLNRRARRIGEAAGGDFEVRDARPGTKGKRPRGRASVGTTGIRSRRMQARDNILQRALNAGR